MNNPGVGGRGKRAPYKTTHYRMPVALKPIVEDMAAKYRELVDEYEADDPALVQAVISTLVSEDFKNTEEFSKISEQIQSLEIQLKLAKKENKELTEQLASLEKSNYTLLEQLKKLKCAPQAISILENALLLKANAGGAIKEKIKEALYLIK
jgi:predicted RNase H-like nuclease (RuvC/YqgF family)